MFDRHHAALAGIAVISIIDASRNRILAQKQARLFLAAAKAYEADIAAHERQMKYLCKMIDDHGVPFTEFDAIALHIDNQ
jgi:hypothetical protein